MVLYVEKSTSGEVKYRERGRRSCTIVVVVVILDVDGLDLREIITRQPYTQYGRQTKKRVGSKC